MFYMLHLIFIVFFFAISNLNFFLIEAFRKKRKAKKASKSSKFNVFSLSFIKYHICVLLWVCSRRHYLRYCYHSIFVLHLMNDKDRMIAIAQIASCEHILYIVSLC